MKIRTRIIIAFTLVVTFGFYHFMNWIIEELRPRYVESIEEVLVDTSQLLAGVIESEIKSNTIQKTQWKHIFANVYNKEFEAKIYDLSKTHVDIVVYVTDAQGVVLFHSESPNEEGQDYSSWNDVYLTLKGKYGARSTRRSEADPGSSVLYVAAPIIHGKKIIGVVTAGKPTANVNVFIQSAKPQFLIAGTIAAITIIFLGFVLSFWITGPIGKLVQYARSVSKGDKTSLPELGGSELQELGDALESMRESLDGKAYIERYVQTLTHEIKSPLSGILGATELLQTELTKDQQSKLIENIHNDSSRIKEFVNQMLRLSHLEKQQKLNNREQIQLSSFLRELIEERQDLASRKGITISFSTNEEKELSADPSLLKLAIGNLVQNAIEFSDADSEIQIHLDSLERKKGFFIRIKDQGAGIPDYAKDKIFDRFYSLPRAETSKKSTGLGLSISKEIISLHGGSLFLEASDSQNGTSFRIDFPA